MQGMDNNEEKNMNQIMKCLVQLSEELQFLFFFPFNQQEASE